MVLLAFSCGLIAANIYYAQALIGEIAPALGIPKQFAGAVVALSQIGYGAGLFLIVSLADMVENRRLILLLVAGTCVAQFALWAASSAAVFLAFSFVVGLCSVGAQILLPLAAHIYDEESRGRVLGAIIGGLVSGIMLARPIASMSSSLLGWRSVFGLSAIAMAALGILLAFRLPARQPSARMSYSAVLGSSLKLLLRTPTIRRRTAYQATMFAMFNLFWTAVPLLLQRSFGLGQRGIALFALAGAGGAFAAPLAGRLADSGRVRVGTAGALAAGAFACCLAGWAGAGASLAGLVVSAIVLDAATQTNQVVGQRVLYSMDPEARGRINAVYMTVVFLVGAVASTTAAWTFEAAGWRATATLGALLGFLALALFLTEGSTQAVPFNDAEVGT